MTAQFLYPFGHFVHCLLCIFFFAAIDAKWRKSRPKIGDVMPAAPHCKLPKKRQKVRVLPNLVCFWLKMAQWFAKKGPKAELIRNSWKKKIL
jgi:hypothetical protein